MSKSFIVRNNKFELAIDNVIVSEACFQIEKPDSLLNNDYVGLCQLVTLEPFRNKGYMTYMLLKIFKYVKRKFKIKYILLNVYANNDAAIHLYFRCGFHIYKIISDEQEGLYYTLMKVL